MELLAVKLEKKQNGIIEVYAEIFFLGSVSGVTGFLLTSYIICKLVFVIVFCTKQPSNCSSRLIN